MVGQTEMARFNHFGAVSRFRKGGANRRQDLSQPPGSAAAPHQQNPSQGCPCPSFHGLTGHSAFAAAAPAAQDFSSPLSAEALLVLRNPHLPLLPSLPPRTRAHMPSPVSCVSAPWLSLHSTQIFPRDGATSFA